MINPFKHSPSIWEYLDKSGVLINGTEEQIKAAKKAYRQQYLLKYKQWQRANKPEFTIHFSKGKDEFGVIRKAAAEHKMKIPGFIKAAVFAYLSKTYLTPNHEEVARLELILGQIANDIQEIAKRSRVILSTNPEHRYSEIEKRMGVLQRELSESLRNPQTVEELVMKSVKENPTLNETLLAMLSQNNHDYKNQITQETELSPTP